MNILVLDNGNEGQRIDNWGNSLENNTGIIFQNKIEDFETIKTLDILVMHYNDFYNETYSENDIYCFLQGLYFDKKEKISSASTEGSWCSFMVDFSDKDSNWNNEWFKIGSKCKNALFFTAGGYSQFLDNFRKIIEILRNIEIKVGYCSYSTAKERINKVLKDGITTKYLYDYSPYLEALNDFLKTFLPLDIDMQALSDKKVNKQEYLNQMSESSDYHKSLPGELKKIQEKINKLDVKDVDDKRLKKLASIDKNPPEESPIYKFLESLACKDIKNDCLHALFPENKVKDVNLFHQWYCELAGELRKLTES